VFLVILQATNFPAVPLLPALLVFSGEIAAYNPVFLEEIRMVLGAVYLQSSNFNIIFLVLLKMVLVFRLELLTV